MGDRVRVAFDGDLRRRRLSVLFRPVLAFPALTVLVLVTPFAAVAAVAAWLAALVRGRVPARLHRALRVYVRYGLRVSAWLFLVTGTYPRLRRDAPPTLEAERSAHSRASVLVRPLLCLPGVVLGTAFAGVLLVNCIAAWFTGLALGRTTSGLRELGAFCLRYHAEALSFLLLVTSRTPRLEPPDAR